MAKEPPGIEGPEISYAYIPEPPTYEKEQQAQTIDRLAVDTFRSPVPPTRARSNAILSPAITDIPHPPDQNCAPQMLCSATPVIKERGPYSAEFHKRQKEFAALAEIPTKGIIQTIRQLGARCISQLIHIRKKITLQEHTEKVWETTMAAEHMTKGQYSGALQLYTIPKTLNLLQQTVSLPNSLIRSLEYAKKIARMEVPVLQTQISKTTLAKTVKKDVQSLNPNEQLAIPIRSSDLPSSHAMVMLITCTGISPNGKKEYTVVHYNSGFGIENYHYDKIVNGRKKFQTNLTITGVSEDNLCDPNSSFFLNLFSNPTNANFYENILPSLKGSIAPPSDDPRQWSHGQIGGSCAVFSYTCLVKSQLSTEEYKTFREIGRLNIVFESVRHIRHGWESTSDQKIIVLETVRKLKQSYQKRGYEVPTELEKIETELEYLLDPEQQRLHALNESFYSIARGKRRLNEILFEASRNEEGQMVGKDWIDDFNMAFTLLQEGKSTQQSRAQLFTYFERGYLRYSSTQQLSPQEKVKLSNRSRG